MVTVRRCWWQAHPVGDFFNVKNRSPISSKVTSIPHKLTATSVTNINVAFIHEVDSTQLWTGFKFANWQNFEFISTFYYAIDSNKWSEIRIEQLSRIVYLVLFKCSITTLTFILKIQRWVIISTLELNYYSSKAQLGSWYCMVYRHSSYCSTKWDFDC